MCAALAALWPLAAVAAGAAPPSTDAAFDTLAHDIFKQLIEIDTSDSTGNVTTAAEALAQRFRDAGFPAADLALLGPKDRKKNLVVRLHGSGAHKPVLLIGHLDVVEAKRADWTYDPYKLVEKDGFYYGRGALDMKDGDAVMAAALIRMRQQGVRPGREIIAAFTADEEGGCCNGVSWLLKNHRELIDAEFVLNQDDWSVMAAHGVPRVARLVTAEKLYSDYQLSVTNRGGHSSVPRPDNAIYELARGLTRLAGFQFPFELNSVNRGYFEQMAREVAKGQEADDMRAILKRPPDAQALARLSRDPDNLSMTRTTCVATRLDGRSRQQRPAAAGRGGGELPDLPRAYQGGDPPEAHRGAERPADHRALHRGRRLDLRARNRRARRRAGAAASRRDALTHDPVALGVAAGEGDPDSRPRSIGCQVHARRRAPDLHLRWCGGGPRRRARPWTRRAGRGRGVLQVEPVLLSLRRGAHRRVTAAAADSPPQDMRRETAMTPISTMTRLRIHHAICLWISALTAFPEGVGGGAVPPPGSRPSSTSRSPS